MNIGATGNLAKELNRLAAKELPMLLREDGWHTRAIRYEKPHVNRVWRQHGKYRIMLHEILPCEREEVFFHPHQGPSAVLAFGGAPYEMGIGYGPGPGPPSIACIMYVQYKAPDFLLYEMSEPLGWHYVRPVGAPSLSVMLLDAPWPNAIKMPPVAPEAPLDDYTKNEILIQARARFQPTYKGHPR
jgi:hypothetical protein